MSSNTMICPETKGKSFFTLDKSSNTCIHPAVQCSLGSKSVYGKSGTLLQPCYNKDGTKNSSAMPPIEPQSMDLNLGTATPKPPSLAKQCAALQPFGDSSTGEPSILTDIKALQAEETKILNDLQKQTDKATGDASNVTVVNGLLKKLKPIQDARVRLMNQLKYAASSSQCSLAGSRRALQDQVAMLMIADDQLNMMEKQTEELINIKNNKHRMVQITNYEYDRFESHAGIFKTIAFCSLFILGGVYLNKIGWGMLGNSIIAISIAVGIFLTIKRIWWNFWRNPMDWNRYNWFKKTPGGHQPSVWEVDKQFFDRGYNEASQDFHSASKAMSKDIHTTSKDISNAASSVSSSISDATKGLATNVTKGAASVNTGVGNKKGMSVSESFAPFN